MTDHRGPPALAAAGDHVCLLSNLYPPETIGGAETYVQTVAEGLAERGVEVSVITTASREDARSGDGPFVEHQAGVRVHRFVPLNLYTPYSYRDQSAWKKPLMHLVDLWNQQARSAVDTLLEDIDPDVIHLNNFGGLSPAVISAASTHAPIVLTLHDYRLLHIDPGMFVGGEPRPLPRLMGPFRAYNRRVVQPYVDRVLAPSKFMLDRHARAGFFEETPTDVLRLGVPQADRGPQSQAAGPPRLLYVGQLADHKGVDTLIGAVSRLETDLRLDIVGRGEVREQLEAQARGDDRITFHGFVSEQSLDAFYREATLSVVPSRYPDNSPMVIYESFARGTPVIGTEMGGIPELIATPTDEAPARGAIVPPEDPAKLARAIRSVQQQSDEYAEAAYAAAEQYTLRDHLDGLTAEYEALREPSGADTRESVGARR